MKKVVGVTPRELAGDESEDVIWAQIAALQMEVAGLSDEYIARVRVEREGAQRVRDEIVTRATEEYGRFGTLQGFISAKSPETATRIAELEGSGEPLSPVEEELLQALKYPYEAEYAQLPPDLAQYIYRLQQTDPELMRVEFLASQYPEQERAEKQARIWELMSSIPVRPTRTRIPTPIFESPASPIGPGAGRGDGQVGRQVSALSARMTALEAQLREPRDAAPAGGDA